LQGELREARDELAARFHRIAGLEAGADALRDEIEELKKDIETLGHEKERLNGSLAEVRDELNAAHDKFQEEVGQHLYRLSVVFVRYLCGCVELGKYVHGPKLLPPCTTPIVIIVRPGDAL
jgi:septal ring factor EnvC (AmiA/AmiB activator)